MTNECFDGCTVANVNFLCIGISLENLIAKTADVSPRKETFQGKFISILFLW